MADIYYKLDKSTRADLIATVRRAAIEILEGPQENWITADEVSKLFPFFNKEWMKKYAYLLQCCVLRSWIKYQISKFYHS